MATEQGLSPDQWLTIPEAAQRLGLSIVTVRRRIKQGSLEAELQPGKRGAEYRVRLPSGTSVSSVEAAHEDPQNTDQTEALTTVVTTLLARLHRLEDERLAEGKAAAEWKVKAEQLEWRLAEQRAELERYRRPWWHRWLGR